MADCGAIAARICPSDQDTACGIDTDAMGVASLLVPRRPAMHSVASALELADGIARKASLHVQRVSRLTEREAAREKARHRPWISDAALRSRSIAAT